MTEFATDRPRALRIMLKVAWEADRARAAAALGMCVVQALLASSFAWWLKLLVDEVTIGPVLGLTLSIVASTGLDYAGSRVRQTLNEKAHHLIELRLLDVVGRAPTLQIQETPAHLTQLELLDSESWEFGETIPAMINVVNIGLRITTTVVLLSSVDPLLLLLPLFGLPGVLLSGRMSALYERGSELAADANRHARDLYELAITAGPAKEIRVSRLQEEIVARFRAAQRDRRTIEMRHLAHSQAIGLATRLIFVLGYVGAVALMTHRALTGVAGVSDVLLTAVLAGQVLGLVVGSSDVVQWALRTLLSASRYLYLVDVAKRDRDTGATPVGVPDVLRSEIRFEGVCHRYSTERGDDVLSGLDLVLPAGKTVAIVGDNGAGKSTLVKLLCGMYRPTAGRILIDGADLASLDVEQWRLRITAGFQDHARFEFTLQESVGIGDLEAVDDGHTVLGALERAGASGLLPKLPSGLATQLGPAWPGGVDLSGGEWQKLAIGRAMMRRRPLLLILDEPTAALDAETEHRLFERWTRAARRSSSAAGAVTVLVSHRLSTVRMADLIVVLDGGRVAETGTHEQLLKNGALYAALFNMQSVGYR